MFVTFVFQITKTKKTKRFEGFVVGQHQLGRFPANYVKKIENDDELPPQLTPLERMSRRESQASDVATNSSTTNNYPSVPIENEDDSTASSSANNNNNGNANSNNTSNSNNNNNNVDADADADITSTFDPTNNYNNNSSSPNSSKSTTAGADNNDENNNNNNNDEQSSGAGGAGGGGLVPRLSNTRTKKNETGSFCFEI